MAIKEDVTVRLGLDKTGFDSGLSGAGKSLKKFASFFGIATSAVFLKRIVGEVGELASEVAKLRDESIPARDAFDKMANGIEVVGEVAGVTADQMDKMRKASKMFTTEDLDALAKGAGWWSSIKESISIGAGKLAAFTVNASSAFFGGISGVMAGTSEAEGRTVESDRIVGKALRDERERLRLLEEQKDALDYRQKMFAEEDVYLQKMVEAEQTRIDQEREKLALKIQSLEKDKAAAQLSRQQSLSDRSGFSVAELAAMDQNSPLFSQGAIPSILKARSIQMMEQKAKFARLSGNTGLANVISQEALNMRGELAPLTSAEGDPLPKIAAISADMKSLLDLATGQGIIIQPRMSK